MNSLTRPSRCCRDPESRLSRILIENHCRYSKKERFLARHFSHVRSILAVHGRWSFIFNGAMVFE